MHGGAVEDDLSLVEDEEAGTVVDAMVGDGFHGASLLVIAIHGEDEGVLQTVGDEQRSGVGDVALFEDEFDDGGGGDGV